MHDGAWNSVRLTRAILVATVSGAYTEPFQTSAIGQSGRSRLTFSFTFSTCQNDPMAQRNVCQQNEATFAEIERTTALAIQEPFARWLPRVLDSRGMSARDGILARLKTTPDQTADICEVLWLSKDRRFVEFTVAVSRVNDSVEVECCQDITDKVVISRHVPGTGKSFGFIALEVLAKLV